jgi:uncharacterized protein YdhG (YjbR/CyaY superfamily)
MEIKASSFKLRANAPEGRKAISYQQSPIWQRKGVGITASSFKLRANAPEGRKAISYQPPPSASSGRE